MKKNPKKHLTAIVIPAYNCQNELEKILKELNQHGSLIIVDDYSNPLIDLKTDSKNIEIIRHEKNIGYGGALRTGIKRALKRNFKYIVLIDGDGQHFPKEIPKILEPLYLNQADLVTGTRYGKSKPIGLEIHRNLGIRAITAYANFCTDNSLNDFQCGFRAFNRQVAEKLNLKENRMEASIEIINDAGKNKFRIKQIPVKITYDVTNAHSKNIFLHGMKLFLYCTKIKLGKKN